MRVRDVRGKDDDVRIRLMHTQGVKQCTEMCRADTTQGGAWLQSDNFTIALCHPESNSQLSHPFSQIVSDMSHSYSTPPPSVHVIRSLPCALNTTEYTAMYPLSF